MIQGLDKAVDSLIRTYYVEVGLTLFLLLVGAKMTVEYKEVPNFPGYKAGTDGTVWSFRQSYGKEMRKLQQTLKNNGYLQVSMLDENRVRKYFGVHQVILRTFVGPPKEGEVVRHKDGNRANNVLVNLEYGTRSENSKDREKHGKSFRGEANPKNAYDETTVRKIRSLYLTGLYTYEELANMFGICNQSHVGKIIRMELWPQATEFRDIPGFPGYQVSNDGQVRSCRKDGPGESLRKDWKFLSVTLHPDGYMRLVLYQNGKPKLKTVGRLVLESFASPALGGFEASHLNGDRADNRLENLRWETKMENNKRKENHGIHFAKKLTDEEVKDIRLLYRLGLFSSYKLAERYQVSRPLINKIVRREIWTHI